LCGYCFLSGENGGGDEADEAYEDEKDHRVILATAPDATANLKRRLQRLLQKSSPAPHPL